MQKVKVIAGSLVLVAIMSGFVSTSAGAAGPEVSGLIQSERILSTFLLREMRSLRKQVVSQDNGTMQLKASCPKVEQGLFAIASGRTDKTADVGRILQGFFADRSDAMMMATSSATPLDTSSMPTYQIEVELGKGVTTERLTAALDEVIAYAEYDANLRN